MSGRGDEVRREHLLGGGRRVEVKNISSFKEVEKALQTTRYSGRGPSRERDQRDEALGRKEEHHHRASLEEAEQDYRYFPEARPPASRRRPRQVAKVRRAMPEVSDAKAARSRRTFGLSSQLAKEIAANRELFCVLRGVGEAARRYKEMASLIVGELSGRSSATGIGDISRRARGAGADDGNQLDYEVAARDALSRGAAQGQSPWATVVRAQRGICGWSTSEP